MANKRKIISQLPAVNQTDALSTFFSATADQLFQPGESEYLSGYIGQKPSYYNPATDFYIPEGNALRTEYQLEPGMVSINSGGIITDTLTYDDLLNYLNYKGAFTSNNSRLFEGDYYSWAPPVDLDKINNYNQYLWMGSLTTQERYLTTINLYAPRNTYFYSGNGVNTFSLPPIIPGITTESPAVLVNGILVPSNALGDDETISIDVSGFTVGTVIETIRYGNIRQSMNGEKQFDYTPFLTWEATTPYMQLSGYGFVPRYFNVGELVYVSGTLYICNTSHTALNFMTQIENWTVLGETFIATTGSKIRPIDGTQVLGGYTDNQQIGSISALSPTSFFVDGVGSSILLTSDYTADVGGSTPHYIVIDRRSLEGSPWTRRNVWVHQATLTWTGLDFGSRIARRQIIEFLPNIQMFNYGFNRLDDVQGVLSNTTATAFDNFGIYSSDDNLIGDGQINLSQINGQLFGRLHENQYDNSGITDSTIIGSVQVDNGYILQPNDRLLVSQPLSNEPLLNEALYTVISNDDTLLPSGGRDDVVQLIPESSPKLGDMVRVIPGAGTLSNAIAISAFADYDEYWFNGIQWVLAQSGASFPLFELFDSDENALDDQNIYPGSNFMGSRLFGYLIGTGTPDTILGFPLTFDQYGQPIFEIDSVETRVTYTGGTVSGFYYHKFISNNTYSNNWFASPQPSHQQLVNGVYSIPSNLQANPGNLEITQISRNQWYSQFSEIMSNQIGFTGYPYSINNWRDTEKYLGYGNEILQHRSPLLKTMLICENGNFDLPNALHYVEQEYVRFRNKFVQTIVNFNNDGTLTSSDAPNVWVSTILNQLRLNKSVSIANSTTISFPFWGSTMAGGQYFIPPTPSSMNLAIATSPSMIIDTTYSPPMTMIRGHDGSMVPTYGDYRDQIILALEQAIYNNIPSNFKTEARPVFDMAYYMSSVSYINVNGYYSYETLSMLEPFFQRWVQANRLDYRTNNNFNPNDPFTWNYSTCVDINEQPLPGFWRGIYRYYFNTDRPNIAPWEMLGFGEMPVWWTAIYGPAPYTSGNTKLWNDMASGRIAGGPRIGIDPRYVNSVLLNFLPVDSDGNLLDPIACGLVASPPIYNKAMADWVFGDGSPIETLWINSPSYRFALAQLSFLTKPSRFVEQGWDTINNIQDGSGQWIYALTGNRPKDSELIVHGEINSSGQLTVALGVQQWISDFMVSRGQNPLILGNAIRGLDVRLIHKLAGFTTGDNLQVVAESFGLIENSSDIIIKLYRSTPINEQFYSGVLIERVENGWRVIGYNVLGSYFFIIPEDTSSQKGIITLSNTSEPVVNPWRPNTYYRIGINVGYNDTVYSCNVAHTSGLTFESKFWTAISALPETAPKVVTYANGNGSIQSVPYGTVFATYQEISNFLLSYERYLVANGWIFDKIDPSTQIVMDWKAAVKEFLGWSQVNWQVGNFITLSPGAFGINFTTSHGSVLDILSTNNTSYGMLDRAGLPISRKNVIVNRTDETTTFLSKNNDIYGIRATIGEIEHALIFNNFTIFGDVLYEPQFNLRQPRLLLQGPRSKNWNGRLDIPGYILTNNNITSNFDKAAVDLLTMFDIEKGSIANATLTNHARFNIGYSNRDYLTSLVISDIEQFEFYQGLIHQKGAVGAFDKLLRSTYIAQSGNLNFFEEWAILLNQFGAVNTTDRIAFYFGQSDIVRDPQYIQFAVNGANTAISNPNLDWNQLTDSPTTGLDPNWVERPNDPLVAFPRRETYVDQIGDYPVGGYVRLDEVEYTVFYSFEIPSLYVANSNSLATSDVIWTHSNEATRDVSNSLISNWFVVGNAVGNSGVWTVSNSVSLNYGYIANNVNGQYVFRSHPGDGPYATNNDAFKPYVGQTYQASFMIQKTTNDANTIACLKPGFLVANSSSFTDGLGIISGQGYDISNNIIDTSSWALNTYYTVSATWTCKEPSVSAFARIFINSYQANAIFEVASQTLTIIEGPKWDTLNVYNMSIDGNVNYIANVVTNSELPSISNNTLVVNTLYPHGLIPEDQGLYIVVDGMSSSTPELQGVQTLYKVLSPNSFSINLSGTTGYDVPIGQYGPALRIMRSTHFSNIDQLGQIQNGSSGQLTYIDGSPWAVYKLNYNVEHTTDWSGNIITTTSEIWEQYRVQPKRIDGNRIQASLIYDIKTLINDTETAPQPLELASMTVVSPLTGILPGEAISQIDYILEYDPAKYSDITISSVTQTVANVDVNQWGSNQTGRVWWDVSTVRFLETETDDVNYGLDMASRYNSEVSYRVANWGQIAPATSVDIYEWVQSTVNPIEYINLGLTDTTGLYSGVVYNASSPSWVEQVQYSSTYGNVTYYYFWVKNRTITPKVSFRKISVDTIAKLITNPLSEDIPWISPIMDNGLLVGGVQTYVNDAFGTVAGTVLQVEVNNHGIDNSGYRDEGVIHDQWQLLRPNDETSLPSEWLWAKMRDSLVGFDDNKQLVPNNSLKPNISSPSSLPPIWQTPSGNLPNTSGHAPLTFSGDSFVATLVAIDPQQGDSMLYYISNGTLPLGAYLNPQTGVISGNLTLENINNELDTSNYTWYFTVNAFNGVTYSSQDFSITVNVNNPPVWITNSGIISSDYTGNSITYQLLATDPQSDTLVYSLANSTLPSSLNLNANGLISGTYPPIVAPPANTIVNFSVNVTNGFFTIPQNFEIVSFYTSLPPIWQYPASGSLGVFDQNTLQNIYMMANSPSLLPITYNISNGTLPPGLSISSNAITGIIWLASNAAVYNFTVKALDSYGSFSTRNFNMSITGNRPPIWITPTGSIGSGFIANSFSYQLEASTPEGYPSPLTYTLANSALPSGMSMNSTGLVNGILPIVSNTTTYYFTVTASDGVVNVSRDFSVTSDIPVTYPPLWITPPGNLGVGASGDSVSLVLVATDTNNLTYSVVAGSLPTGLVLNNVSNTAVISGTLGALANAVVPFTVAVTDGVSIIPQSFTYTISNPAPVTLGFSSPASWTVPSGVRNVMLNWVIGGGGGGSEGTQGGNGAGGGGGGSGGYYHYYGNVACNPGDIFTFNVGSKGYGGRYPLPTGLTPPPNAGNGGDTTILLNGNTIVTAGGGGGAPSATNTGTGFINTPGGIAGVPNGIAGFIGPAGTTDTSSPPGGGGATGPLANSVGGSGGISNGGGDPGGLSAGSNAAYSGVYQTGPAVGYGSGGGGSGVSDRALGSIGWWWGGDGAPGYVEITFPSQGSIGGTPAGSTITLNSHSVYSGSLYPENAAASILFVNDYDSYYPSAANGSVVEMSTHGITSTSSVYTADWNPHHEPASNYEIQAVFVSSSTGDLTVDTTVFGTTLNTWYNLGSSHLIGYNIIAVAHHTFDTEKQITLQINIRRVSDHVIVATNLVNLLASASGTA